MINRLDIYYSKNVGRGLKPVSKTASGLKPINTNKKVKGSGLNQLVKEHHVKKLDDD